MKVIQRHMQSISLMTIAVFLLALGFFVSQQIRSEKRAPRITSTPNMDGSVIGEVPTCTDDESEDAALTCYREAAEVSDLLVMSLVDEIIALESEPSRRVAFLETQIAWEESRNVNCDFVRGSTNDDFTGELQALICLRDHNLARVDQLERYRCDWYQPESCVSEASDQE
jgi:uncharacterized protein YecT (DUF1311 family)